MTILNGYCQPTKRPCGPNGRHGGEGVEGFLLGKPTFYAKQEDIVLFSDVLRIGILKDFIRGAL